MSKIKFRKYDSIGSSDAREDSDYLENCFIDNGDLEVLTDCGTPKRIILGRTGSGKTALLQMVQKNHDAINIPPESLSLNYITNSNVLNFFLDMGVNLNLFFKLLWRHVFSVELIKKRYKINSENYKNNFFQRLKERLGLSKKKERAINYLLDWEDHFWMETEYRIKEITKKVEKDLKGNLASKIPSLSGKVDGSKKFTDQEKHEIVSRGQAVINNIHMRELIDILDYLDDDVFDDDMHKFYITIDSLDEDWVDSRFRYLLIRSLFETQKDFRKVRNVKIITAIRNDLLEKVFRETRDPGFQEEKYRDLYLQLTWRKESLEQLVKERVNFLLRSTYTKDRIKLADVLPKRVEHGINGISYMIRRTLMRPREIIEFFNLCIEFSEGKTSINKRNLLKAEGEYSKRRLRSLQDEWFSLYPTLLDSTVIFLNKLKSELRYRDFLSTDFEEKILRFLVRDNPVCIIVDICNSYVNGNLSKEELTQKLLKIYYKVGLIGIKYDTYLPPTWSFEGHTTIARSLELESSIFIHPTFWRAMGITPFNKTDAKLRSNH